MVEQKQTLKLLGATSTKEKNRLPGIEITNKRISPEIVQDVFNVHGGRAWI